MNNEDLLDEDWIEKRNKWIEEFAKNTEDAPSYGYYYVGGIIGVLLALGFVGLNLYIMGV